MKTCSRALITGVFIVALGGCKVETTSVLLAFAHSERATTSVQDGSTVSSALPCTMSVGAPIRRLSGSSSAATFNTSERSACGRNCSRGIETATFLLPQPVTEGA